MTDRKIKEITVPDISMCANRTCSQSSQCYRFRAVPNEYRQSYFMGSPANADGTCNHFWPLEEATTRIRSMEELDARSRT